MATPNRTDDYGPELEAAAGAATQAGAAINDFYEGAAAAAYVKADGSPVTDADLASDRIIRAVLADRFPSDPILTEEGVDDPARLASSRCWIVDPLDGTAQFVARTGEFDVLIALVVDGRPVVAATYHPPSDLLHLAVAGRGAWIEQDGVRRRLHFPPPPEGAAIRFATSIWHGSPESLPFLTSVANALSCAPPRALETGFNPRLLSTADRPFHAYVGWVPTGAMAGGEWDYAASDLIVHEAGGSFTDLQGRLHRYNRPSPICTGGLLVTTHPDVHARLLDTLRPELLANV